MNNIKRVYVINGKTETIGMWDLEVFADEEDAIERFKMYLDEYEAKLDSEWYAECSEGSFWIEDCEVW